MPHVIVVIGPLGAGKTTLASIMAYLYKSMIENVNGSVELFSNFNLKGSTAMRTYTDWYKVADAQGSIIVWDEAHLMMDSRQSLKKENIVASHVLMFCRKMSSIQIFVTPSITNLDSRVRQMCEVLISATKVGNRGMKFQYFDYQSQNFGVFGKFLHSRFLPAAKIKQIHALNLFDSHSFVGGFPLPKTDRQEEQFMLELENRHNEARSKNELKFNGGDVVAI
jgi:predicted AAA+ superfamily ATPase